MRAILFALLLTLPVHAGRPGADHALGCPDLAATSVDSELTPAGPMQDCAKSPIRLLGGAGTGWTPQCPEQALLVPGHGECQGEPAEGARCVPVAVLPVQLMDCVCGPVIHLPSGWVASSCTCTPALNVGTIESFGTVEC